MTAKNTFLTKAEPPLIAMRDPIIAPVTLATASNRPSCHQMLPVS